MFFYIDHVVAAGIADVLAQDPGLDHEAVTVTADALTAVVTVVPARIAKAPEVNLAHAVNLPKERIADLSLGNCY